jgi:hypothetical protein
MAHFYGNLKGSRGEATRCGTANSGLSVSARSWQGSVHLALYVNADGVTRCRILASTGSTSHPEATLWDGDIIELVGDDVALTLVKV